MKEPISIVVPVYNRENLIIKCLDSIYKQTYRPIRLIVVDNHSTDSTWEKSFNWLSEHKSEEFSTTLLTEPNPGACQSRNRGLNNVETDKVMFFDSDDTMRPDCLETAMNTFQKFQDTDIVTWQAELHLLNGTSRITRFNPKDIFKSHLLHGLLRPQGYMARTSLIKKAGSWNEHIPCWNDWELGVRLLLLNPKVICLSRILTDIYSQMESITGSGFLHSEGKWELALAEICRNISASKCKKKDRLMKIVSYRTMILGAHYHKEGNSKAGHRLLNKSISFGNIGWMLKAGLILAYNYTRLGGRGAYKFFRF